MNSIAGSLPRLSPWSAITKSSMSMTGYGWTWERLQAIYQESPHVRAVLKLFKNSGQGNAIMAAIAQATGDVILTLGQ